MTGDRDWFGALIAGFFAGMTIAALIIGYVPGVCG